MDYVKIPTTTIPVITIAHEYRTTRYRNRDRVMPEFEILLALEGTWVVTLEGKEYLQHPYDFMILPPGIPHTQELASPGYLHRHYALHFSMTAPWCESRREEFYNRAVAATGIFSDSSYEPFSDSVIPVFHSLSDKKTIVDSFKQIIDLWTSHRWPMINMASLRLVELILMVANDAYTGHISHKLPSSSSTSSAISKAIDFINKNYKTKFTMADISKHVDLSEDYLGMIFKKEAGHSVTSYTNYLRIQHAKDLIRSTKMTFQEIAMETGINDVYYFSKLFKKLEGITPTEYARRFLRQAGICDREDINC